MLGRRAFELLTEFQNAATFITVGEAFDDAGRYLPTIMERRRFSAEGIAVATERLSRLHALVEIIPADAYAHLESTARQRLAGRDEDDWPFVALALLLDCPIWTEDRDFFGSGVATWTTDRIRLFFERT